MNSARMRGNRRIAQASGAIAAVGVATTVAVMGLAHRADAAGASIATTAETSTATTAETTTTGDGPSSAQQWRLSPGSGAPQARSGGS